MPKHLILFAAFMLLLTAIFYHPIPNPESWIDSIEATKIYNQQEGAKAESPVVNLENQYDPEAFSAIRW